ncbi:glycine zipper domain-containing protein [Bordetella petrii]|uniref:DUF883 domain-containing protein n=1 Tax=Bordetella petrii TaxID=94624 RepID=A0ABT7W4Y9_9BORD|nr:hypothetical protein [Bordetella petrii]MDM9560263.1 hypothetical protein [Bordetella petrii]
MNNDTDSKSQTGIKAPLPASADEPNNSRHENSESPGDDSNRWFDSVCSATRHSLGNAADASTDFARDSPWKTMGICVAAGVALGVLISLR